MKENRKLISFVLAIAMLVAIIPAQTKKAEAASTFSIVYHDGTTTDKTITKTYNYNTSVTLANYNLFTRSGYYFAGWATQTALTATYASGAVFRTPPNDKVSTKINLYAKWIKKTDVNVKLPSGSSVQFTNTFEGYKSSASYSNPAIKVFVFIEKDGKITQASTMTTFPTLTAYNGIKRASGASEVYFLYVNDLNNKNYAKNYLDPSFSYKLCPQGIQQCFTYAFLSLCGVQETQRGKYNLTNTSQFSPWKLSSKFSAGTSVQSVSALKSLPKYGTVLSTGKHAGVVVGYYVEDNHGIPSFKVMISEANASGSKDVLVRPISQSGLAYEVNMEQYRR